MRNIILDCDPGHDDAIAILLAGSARELNVLGLTIVAGNQTIEKTSRNALNVCNELGLPYKVYSGLSESMVKEKRIISDEIHGETGLDGPTFMPHDRKIEDKTAIDFIIEIILNSSEKITIVATGPLTNIGMALKLQPKIKENIEEIVIMGGSYQLGNITPAAEFNIYVDAEAAYVVFTSGIPVTMVGLDVTRKVQVLPEVVERMNQVQTKGSKLFVELMTFFNKTQKEVFGWEGGPLHDPLTIAYLIDPTVVEAKHMHVDIEIRSEQSYGRTNCDFFQNSSLEKNAKVAVEVDVPKFWDIIEQGLRHYE